MLIFQNKKQLSKMKIEQKSIFFFGYLLLVLPLLYRFCSGILETGYMTKEIVLLLSGGSVLLSGLLFLTDFKKAKTFDFSWFEILFGLFATVHALSIFQAINPVESIFASIRIWLFFAIYLLMKFVLLHTSQATAQKCRNLIFGLAAITTLIYCAMTFYDLGQLKGLDSKSLYKLNKTLGHKNPLSAYLLLLMGFNVLGFLSLKNIQKWLSGLAVIVSVLVILFLQSRTVWLGLLVFAGVVFIGMWLNRRKSANSMDTAKFKRVSLIVGGFLLVGLLGLIASGALGDRFDFSDSQGSRSMNERLEQWSKTTQIIAENPLTGIGADNWKIGYLEKGLQGLKRAMGAVVFVHPHNDFLWLFSEGGLFAILLYLSMILFVIYKIVFSKGQSQQDRLIQIVLLGSLLAFCAMSCLTSMRLIIEHQVLVMLIFAFLIVSLSNKKMSLKQETKEVIKENGKNKKDVNTDNINDGLLNQQTVLKQFNTPALAVWGLIAIIGTSAIALEIGRIKSMRNFINVTKELDKQNHGKVIQISENINPAFFNLLYNGMPVDYYKGLAYSRQKKYPEAQQTLLNALNANPNNLKTLNLLGDVYFKQKDYETAEKYYLKSIQINPQYDPSLFDIARANINLKNFAKCKEWLDKTKTDPKQKAELMELIKPYL